jgi:hypothetical protein
MFKNIEYVGFDGKPELRMRAEELNPVLAGEINTWRDSVEVKWGPAQGSSGLSLSLSLSLPNGVRESRSGTIPSEAFDNPLRRASRCGRVWYDLLGGVVRKIDARIEKSLFETAEAWDGPDAHRAYS